VTRQAIADMRLWDKELLAATTLPNFGSQYLLLCDFFAIAKREGWTRERRRVSVHGAPSPRKTIIKITNEF
jgi:hypothetical protein